MLILSFTGAGKFGGADGLAGMTLSVFGDVDSKGDSRRLEPVAADFTDIAELRRRKAGDKGVKPREGVVYLCNQFRSAFGTRGFKS